METRRPRNLATTAGALTAGLAGVLLLAACGGSPPAAASPPLTPTGVATSISPSSNPATSPTSDADSGGVTAPAVANGGDGCSLVTEQEAHAAIGHDPGKGKPFSSHGATQCQYGTYQTGFVLVNLTPTQGKAAFDLMHGNSKLGHAIDVTGLGDRAFAVSAPHTASIYFAKGDALVVVLVEGPATAPPKAQALALAKAVSARV